MAAAQRPASSRASALDAAIRAWVDSGFSGVALVAVGNGVRLERAYGRGAARPDTASAFWIASMTKGFTAAAILKLQERGRLSLRDSLARFLPGAPGGPRAITLEQLLTHTSGLAGHDAAAAVVDRDAAVRAILAQPLAHVPGTAYRYMDDDYVLLAAVVEIASGRRWERFVETELLRPAGMRHTGFWCQRRAGVPRPIAGTDGARTRCDAAHPDDWAHRGASGMSSTAGDLLRWTRALRAGAVLRPSSVALLETPHVFVRREPPADVDYGYGVRVYVVDGRVAEVMHSGSGEDGHTSIVRLRGDTAIIVLSNAGRHAEATWASWVAR